MKTVLIIEDNEEMRENTCEYLELSGYHVIASENGTAGLAAAASSRPDVILCDIVMPGVNGYEVIKQLKDNPSTSSIPFIYLTANGEKKDISIALKMGADGFIRKPFLMNELISEISKVCRTPVKKS